MFILSSPIHPVRWHSSITVIASVQELNYQTVYTYKLFALNLKAFPSR